MIKALIVNHEECRSLASKDSFLAHLLGAKGVTIDNSNVSITVYVEMVGCMPACTSDVEINDQLVAVIPPGYLYPIQRDGCNYLAKGSNGEMDEIGFIPWPLTHGQEALWHPELPKLLKDMRRATLGTSDEQDLELCNTPEKERLKVARAMPGLQEYWDTLLAKAKEAVELL